MHDFLLRRARVDHNDGSICEVRHVSNLCALTNGDGPIVLPRDDKILDLIIQLLGQLDNLIEYLNEQLSIGISRSHSEPVLSFRASDPENELSIHPKTQITFKYV